MPARPPPLPEETLARVMRLATFDGRVVMGLATAFALMTALAGDRLGAAIGCMAIGAAVIELHGVGRLRLGDPEGMRWLVRSQLAIVCIVLLYTTGRLLTYDEAQWTARVMTPELKRQLSEGGLSDQGRATFLHGIHYIAHIFIGLVVSAYQGGMAWYYHRRRGPVRTALDPDAGSDADERHAR